MTTKTPTPRDLVCLAAKRARLAPTRRWLRSDERGAFEALARGLLARAAEHPRRSEVSDAQVHEEIADLLVLSAMEAERRYRLAKKS